MGIRNVRERRSTRPIRPRRGLPSNPANDAARVGVRELRQNLSVYLERVKEGETLTVTEHGAVVAMLTPPVTGSVLERLVADGRAVAPRGSLRDLAAPRPASMPGPPAETIVSELRDERLS